MTRIRATFVFVLSLVAGCALMPAETPNLDGTSWRAVMVAGEVPVAGSEPTMMFEGGRISGSTGCNRYSGPVQFDRSRLTLTEISQTLIGCDGRIGEIEGEFGRILGRAGTFRIEGGNLVIAGPAGEAVFRADSTVR